MLTWQKRVIGCKTSDGFQQSRRKAEAMASVLEAIMLVCFGLSWPINAIKAWKSKTAVGTSWMFLALITFGYIAGIAAKFVGGNINWVLAVYFINLAALAVNWIVYVHNRVLDARRKAEKRRSCA